jgi:hypothetical protein
LYEDDGTTEITHNDDDDGLDSLIEYVLPYSGTYYLKVCDYYHPSEGGSDYFYTLSLSGTCGDPNEPNDMPGSATAISYGSFLTDPNICPIGDEDYYSYVGNFGDTIMIDIDASIYGSPVDSVLYLYHPDGVTLITSNDDYDGLDSRIEFDVPDTDTYYFKVRDFSHPFEGGPDYS